MPCEPSPHHHCPSSYGPSCCKTQGTQSVRSRLYHTKALNSRNPINIWIRRKYVTENFLVTLKAAYGHRGGCTAWARIAYDQKNARKILLFGTFYIVASSL